MLNFVNSCLTMIFIKLGGVLSYVMALNIIFFHNSNRIMAGNILVMWGNKIFRAPITVESSSFIINFCFLAADILFSLKSPQKITIYTYEINKIKSGAVNKQIGSSQLYSGDLRNEIVNSGVVLLHKLLL